MDAVFSCLSQTQSKEQKEDCPEMCFFKSILPDFIKMTPSQKHKFRMKTLQTIGEILYEGDRYKTKTQSVCTATQEDDSMTRSLSPVSCKEVLSESEEF